MKSAPQFSKNDTSKPAPRMRKAKPSPKSLAARVARLSANPRQEVEEMFNAKRDIARIRSALLRIAPQQILALAMLTVAVAVVDRPNAEAAAVLGIKMHVSPTLFALVTLACGAILLVRPYTVAFILLTLPFVLFIVAEIMYVTLVPNSAYTAPVLFAALYFVVTRFALTGKRGT